MKNEQELLNKIEQLRSYWSLHKDNAEVVQHFASDDLFNLLGLQ